MGGLFFWMSAFGPLNPDVFNASISLSNTTPSPRDAGDQVVYVIKYSTQSNTNNFSNAEMVVTLPAPDVGFITFTGTTDVANTSFQQVGNEHQFTIDMIDPLPAGSTGQMELVVNYEPGSLCDGTVVTATLDRSADNTLATNEGPVTADVTINDNTEPFVVDLSSSGLLLTDREVGLAIDLQDNATLINMLESATLSLTVPSDVEVQSCDGCDQAGSLPGTGFTELTWNLGTISSGSLPDKNVSIIFPDATYDVGNMETFTATLRGTDNICSSSELEFSDERTLTLQSPPPPMPSISCITPTLSTATIGESGTLGISYKNSSTLAELEDFTYSLVIPPAMEVAALPNVLFTDGLGASDLETGLSATLTYTTNFGGPYSIHFTTNTTSNATPALGAGEYIISFEYAFNDPVPDNFMPVNNLIEIDYTVSSTGTDGSTISGANPRIGDGLDCVDCGGSPDFDCLDIDPTISATFDASPVTPSGNCSKSVVVRDPEVGIQRVQKSRDRNGYYPRDVVTFTLSFENCGPDPLTNTVVTDEMSAGLELVAGSYSYTGFSSDPADPAVTTNMDGSTTLVWNIGNLPASTPCQEYTISFQATVADMIMSNRSNCFDIDGQLNGNQLDDCTSASDGSTLRDCVNVPVLQAGPNGLAKTNRDIDLPNNRIFPEETVEYTIGWTIYGGFDATNLVVTDQLPAGLTFEDFQVTGYSSTLTDLSGWNANDVSFTEVNGELTWDFGALVFPGDPTPQNTGDNDQYELTYTITVDEGAVGNYQNCFDITAESVAGMGDNIRMDSPSECHTLNVNSVGPVNANKSFTGNNQRFPTQEIEYTLTFDNAGPFAVQNVSVTDQLPNQLEFIEGSIEYPETNGIQLPDPDADPGATFTYDAGNNTLTWTWDELPGAPAGEATTEPFTITFRAMVKPGVDAGVTIQNCFEVDVSGNNPNVEPRRSGGNDYIVRDCSNNITVLKLAQVSSRKGIKGECDNEFKFFDPDGPKPPDAMNLNGIGQTFEGGSADYRLEICNIGNVAVDEFVLIDILPWIGDIGVSVDADRESAWRPNLADTPRVNMDLSSPSLMNDDYLIYYSVEQSPCRDALKDGSGNPLGISPCTGPNWTTTTPADLANVQAIKIEFKEGRSIGKGEKLVLEWPMVAPAGSPVGEIAWNSFAYQGIRMDNMERFLVAEPNKVGILIKEDPKAQIGDYVWMDRNLDGVQNEPPIDGINGVKVVLWQSTDMAKGNGDDVKVDSTVTGFDQSGFPGYYLFPNLDPGNYYLVFDYETIPETSSPVDPDLGGDDALDSDADLVMGMTPLEELVANEDNRTFDLGLNPANCDYTTSSVEKNCISNDVENPNDDQVELLAFTVEKEKLGDREGDEEAGANTYTLVIQKCTSGPTENDPVSVEQLFVQGGLEYGVTYQPGDLTELPDSIFDVPEGVELKMVFYDEENRGCYYVEILSGCRDYGDLPDTYGTTGEEGAWHNVQQDKRLGSCVDSDDDGQPDPYAGYYENGDDGNTGRVAYGDCEEERGGDDEDGIEFLTPLIPGDTACIRITYTLPSGTPGFLNAWMDFDGDGTFTDLDTVGFISLDGSEFASTRNLSLPAGPVTDNQVVACFVVPDYDGIEEFADGSLFARFRLSCDGGLEPAGGAPDGEVEDYFRPLAKVGNLVWNDYSNNGLQNTGEPGINEVVVTLIHAGEDGAFDTPDDFVSTDTTGVGKNAPVDGRYYFCGLLENDTSMYKILVTTPEDYLPGKANQIAATDSTDSDGQGFPEPDAVEQVQVMFLLDDVTTLPQNENGLIDEGGSFGGFPDTAYNETFDFAFTESDFGDLPPEYGTDEDFPEEPAEHTVQPDKFLGSGIDSERDGTPTGDAMGDTNDENGITFLTPLVPGDTAKVRIQYTFTNENLDGFVRPDQAYINAWMDTDGEGGLAAEDQITWLSYGPTVFEQQNLVGSTNLVLDQAVDSSFVACFIVPENAVLPNANGYFRFRMGCEPDMPPVGPITGGEVEDYIVPLGKIGNLVWNDYNYNGQQDSGEPGIAGVPVKLIHAGEDEEFYTADDFITWDTTGLGKNAEAEEHGDDGRYYFCGLLANDTSMYKLVVYTPEDMTPGRVMVDGVAADSDSDGDLFRFEALDSVQTMFLLDNVRQLPLLEDGLTDLPPGQSFNAFADSTYDQTYDFAFNGIDYGDLPDTYTTLEESNGPQHILQPGKYLGACVDAERDGNPETMAGLFTGGDDGTASNYVHGTCTEAGNDEQGVRFPTPLVPGYEACIEIDYTAIDTSELVRDEVYLSAWIDFEGDGIFSESDRLTFVKKGDEVIEQQNVYLEKGEVTGLRLCFVVPANATFADGAIRARFRLNCETEPADVTPANLLVGGEVEDYYLPVAKLGNYTWLDNDIRGDQAFTDAPNTGVHTPESGVNEVDFVLIWYGEDGVFGTEDDRKYLKSSATGQQGEGEDGIYYFCGLQEGNFRVVPLKYANEENTGMASVEGEDGTVYDLTKADTVTVGAAGIPRYALTPLRKVLTVPDNIESNASDSDPDPWMEVSIPDLLTEGLPVSEDGLGDVPTIYGYPDTLTELRLDAGWVQEPNIEVVQKIVGVNYPESETCGHFNVIVDACIQNTAGSDMDYQMGVPLEHIQMGVDFADAFGGAFVSVVGTPQLIGQNGDTQGQQPQLTETGYDDLTGFFTVPAAPQLYPLINEQFNGNSDTLLFAPGTGLLWPGEKVLVRYVVEVAPEKIDEVAGLNLTFNSKASGLAVNYQGEPVSDYFLDGEQFMAMDMSDDSYETDESYDDPDGETNIGDCWKKAAAFAAFGQVNVVADESCSATIEPGLLLQQYYPECDFPTYPLGGYYRFTADGLNGVFYRPTELDASQFVDGNIRFLVETVNKECEPRWGHLLLEDKAAPVLEDTDFVIDTLFCNDLDWVKDNAETIDPASEYYIGSAEFADACSATLADQYFTDEVQFGDCEDDYFAKLIRTFVAEGPEGGQVTAEQVIVFIRPALEDLHFVEQPVMVQACSVVDEAVNVWPYWINAFGDTLYLNEVDCSFGVRTDEQEFPICNGKGVKIERVISVFDWCAEEVVPVDTVLIKIGDFDAPEFKDNARNVSFSPGDTGADQLYGYAYSTDYSTTLSTGPVDCTAAFSIDLEDLKSTFGFDIEDCEIADYSVEIWQFGPEIAYGIPTGDTIWRETNFPMINGMAAGIPVGVYGLVVEAFDGCYNSAKGVTFFTVKDQIAPVMKCDDDLNVSLSTEGYAKVFAADIDEGSWDNCALESLHVRRAVPQECIDSGNFDMDDLVEEDGVFYTEWADYIEFFCCDLAAEVLIELRGTDNAVDPWTGMAMPNTNICWMELTIEDKVEPICADLQGATTFCNDPALEDLSSFGTPAVPFSNCSNIEIVDLDPIEDLDRCGFGTITRQFQAVKNLGTDNEERSAICEQVINVVAHHDYWVKFPADQAADCGDDVEINGVEFAEEACDLIAVSSEDERFFATQDPDACYKIFRTYRVINWCEYDGEAQPTIVSRDWDGWNEENPTHPDGDDDPGDEDIYVIVKRNFADGLPDTVYYDNDSDPSADNNSADDPATPDYIEDYWWNVVSGNNDPSTEEYYEGYSPGRIGASCRGCNGSTWANDGDQTDSDISGNVQGDDTDFRYGSFGYWQYTQHIVVYDDVDPELTITGEDTFCSISNEDCAGPVEFSITATDLCTDDVEDVTITVRLDVGNDGTVDADVTANHDPATGIFSSRYPQGQHRLVITANDGCGNLITEDVVFDVVDCKEPAPICINGLSIELMPSEEDSTGAAMAVWASDFLASPIFDCNGQGEDGEVTKFSINRVGGEVDADQTGVTFNCEDAGQLIEVEVYAWDAAGNGDFCLTTVQVDDNMGSCSTGEGEGGVAGAIATEEGFPVADVAISLSGARSRQYLTGKEGDYSFTGLEEGLDFSVTPLKDSDAQQGVTTYDMVLMQKHILGMGPLDGPYKLLAADVNKSGSVTTLDLIQLRKLILNVETDFRNNTSWRFVESSYSFRNPANPFAEPFPEVKNINNLEGEIDASFVAIKIGDVNGSALAVVQPRSNRTFNLNLETPDELKAGDRVSIGVVAPKLSEVSGYQFTLQWSDTKWEDVTLVPVSISAEHYGWFPEQGMLTTSYHHVKPMGEGPITLFRLEGTLTEDMRAADLLQLSNRLTVAEAYDQRTGERLNVALHLQSEDPAREALQLLQNAPNPFQTSTTVGFYLPVAGEAEIEFRDARGRLLHRIRGDYAAGFNQVVVDAHQLTLGVVYYTLRTDEGQLTRTMVIQE